MALILVAPAAAGCTTGADAGDTPTLSGPVPAHPATVSGPAIRGRVHTDGAAAAGATVIITVVLRSDEVAGRTLKAASTLGFGCLDRAGCTAPSAEGRVAQDGRFIVAVPKGQTEHDDLNLTVLAQRGAGGRVATSVTLPYADHVGADVGTIPLAAAAGSVITTAGRNHYVPSPVFGAGASPTITMGRATTVSGGDQFVAEGTANDVSGGYDPRVVEDGRVLLVSTTEGEVETAPAVFSSSLLVRGGLVPPSRGAACSVEDADGQLIAQNPCGLTDGMLDTPWVLHDDPRCSSGPCPGTAQDRARDVTVLLTHPVRADLIVIRGCGFTCQVSWSTDGSTFAAWNPAPQDTGPDAVFDLSVPDQAVVAVKVQTATGGFFTSLRQVSVWGSL